MLDSAIGPWIRRNFADLRSDPAEKAGQLLRQRVFDGIMGEVLARYENHVSIDKKVVDAWDIPALRIETKYTDNEFNMARDAVDIAAWLAEAAGFEVLVKELRAQSAGLQHS